MNKMLCCNICDKEFKQANALSYHLRKEHNKNYEEYVIEFVYNGIRPTCKTCGIKLPIRKGGFRKFCSKKCGATGIHNSMFGKTKEKCPNFGIKRTKEQKVNYKLGAKKRWDLHGDMLRTMMKTQQYSLAQKESQIKSWENNIDRKNKVSNSLKLFWDTNPKSKILRKKATDRAIAMLNKGIIGPQAPYKTKWVYNPFTNREEYMHSSWEEIFLKLCINNNCPITKEHEIRIKYKDENGILRIYIPDFIFLNEKKIIEIKGYYKILDLLKLKALKRWCYKNKYKYIILDDVESFKNILNSF